MIINVSKTRSGTARLIDLVLTAIAWFVFLYLLFRGLFGRSEEHTSELQSLMRLWYAVFCLIKKRHRQKCICDAGSQYQDHKRFARVQQCLYRTRTRVRSTNACT